MLTLDVQKRDAKESAAVLRSHGLLPAVFYGPKEPSTPIAVDARALKHAWREAGETTIISLKGAGEQKDTLIRDVQIHPVTGAIVHADFYVLEKGKKIRVAIPLEFIGVAPAEKSGHIVVKTMHEVEIEVLPAELPQHLAVDLSALAGVGDHILVSGIALPSSATLITDAHEIVASVKEFKEEKAEITPAPETIITTAKPDTGTETKGESDKSAKKE